MALFFFHFFDGFERCEDEAGLELASTEKAYLEAVATAHSMWSELLEARQDPSHCAFEISNADNDVLFRFEFSELLDRCQISSSGQGASTAGLTIALKDTHLRASVAREELSASLIEVRAALKESGHLLARLDTVGKLSGRR